MTYLATADRLILGWILLIRASRKHRTLLIVVEPKEEGHRIPVLGSVIKDPVNSRLEPVIGQTLQKVANVDDKGVGDGRHLDPLPVFCKHLQPADAVLPEEGETLQISMSAQADVDSRVLCFRVLWVVVTDAITVRLSVYARDFVKGMITYLPGYVITSSK